MDRDTFYQHYVTSTDVRFFYKNGVGYITWQYGTGGNVELTNLRAFEPRKGYATLLVTEMCKLLSFNPPYHSVYVFTRKSNKAARKAYKSFGFKFVEVPNLYRDGGTMIGTVTFTDLCKNLGVS